MRDSREILNLYLARKKAAGPVMGKMREIRDYYNFVDITLPLPEIDDVSKRPAIANLMIQGIDQNAERIASLLPDIVYPSQKPGQKKADEYASIRRRANLGWWEMNALDVKMARRGRHLIAYAHSPALVMPDFDRGIPRWEPRNPLMTYPAPTIDPDDVEVPDCIFCYSKTLAYLESRYPDAIARLARGDNPEPDDKYECLQYVDAFELSTFILGKAQRTDDGYDWEFRGSEIEPLFRIPNRAGICPAVVAGRVTLDARKGQFDDMVGMFEAQARLTALEIIAVERGVLPSMWAISRPNETANVTVVANPKDGTIGQIKGGDLRDFPVQPGFMTNTTIDRLERAQRLAGGIPAEFGGESASNIRTGRRGESVLANVIDFPIAAAQRMFARSLQAENIRAIATAKGWFGNIPRNFWVSWKGAKGAVTYTPNVHFETDEHQVVYSMPGSDQNGLMILTGQAVGTGTMSKQRAMELNPLIDDVEREKDRMQAEAIDDAVLAGLQSQAANPDSPIPITDLARIKQLVKQDKMDLADAIAQVQLEAQERQAEITAEGAPDTALPGSPESMPGITAEGQGAQVPTTAAPEAPSAQGLSQLLFSLRSAQRQTPQEQAPVGV